MNKRTFLRVLPGLFALPDIASGIEANQRVPESKEHAEMRAIAAKTMLNDLMKLAKNNHIKNPLFFK